MADARSWLRKRVVRLVALVLAGLTAATVELCFALRDPGPPPLAAPEPVAEAAELPEQVHAFCSTCHAYPPADTLPRWAWRAEVKRGFRFFEQSRLSLSPPPVDDVIRYYQKRAPDELPAATIERAMTPLPVRFERCAYPAAAGAVPPTIANVQLAHLSDPKRWDILACDMGAPEPIWRGGTVLAMRADEPRPRWRLLAKLNNPVHAEAVDLDKDGIVDIVVADLGVFPAADHHQGSVVWLRGRKDGGYTPHTLLSGVGRVADVQPADFNGDGKLDLIVAEFGFHETGALVLLENRTTDWDHPVFEPHVIDPRHGAIHVPVADLNGDGRPDFVALFAQEHEEICAFINEGDCRFRKEKLYTASHPAYGSSGIQLVDLDGDGHLDVLYTNGDTLDATQVLKPYHQVQWLRNCGNGRLEFEHRPIAPLYGVHRAVAADFTGDGKLDIVAVSYLPVELFEDRAKLKLDSIILLEQTTPGQFVRHTLETATCDHVTCVVGDVFGTGRPDIITANYMQMNKDAPALVILKNRGQPH